MEIVPYKPIEDEEPKDRLRHAKPGDVFKHLGSYYLLLKPPENGETGVYSYVNLDTFELEDGFPEYTEIEILKSQLSIQDKNAEE